MKYDHIVVGAGSAGATIATRLSEDSNRSVLLLEAGPDYPKIEQLPPEVKQGYGSNIDIWTSSHNWQFTGVSTETAIAPMRVPRGKVTGGTSAINAQMFIRGIPEDYDSWKSAGNDQWSYEQCLPYFRKLENDLDYVDDFHGNEGPMVARRWQPQDWNPDQKAFYESSREYGFPDCHDHNNPDTTGVGSLAFNNIDGVRWSTSIAYLGIARHRLNLTIKPNCHALSLIFEKKRAIGIKVESSGEIFDVFGEEIILSSGSIGSPHLLMLSGIGPASHLESINIPIINDLPGVGQNLRDHPNVWIDWKVQDNYRQIQEKIKPFSQMALRYTASGSDMKNDMCVLMASKNRDIPGSIRMIGVINLALSSGEIKLQTSNPYQQPNLYYNFLDHPEDLRRLRETVRICVEMGYSNNFKEIINSLVSPTEKIVDDDEELNKWMKQTVNTGHHISGTCKMGISTDHMSVVDQYGQVHGLDSLRVVDASIMPDCPRANTNVTTIMIAEKIADHIRNNN